MRPLRPASCSWGDGRRYRAQKVKVGSGSGGWDVLVGPCGIFPLVSRDACVRVPWCHVMHVPPPILYRGTPSGDDAVLVDPMCGSGTILSEAALIARNVAPGLLRPSKMWPFRKWPDADKQVGKQTSVQGEQAVRLPGSALLTRCRPVYFQGIC